LSDIEKALSFTGMWGVPAAVVVAETQGENSEKLPAI
jgi:hypothetical protein